MSRDRSRRNGLSSWCKECRKENARNWSTKYPENAKVSRNNRKLEYKKNPPKYEYMRDYMLQQRYGITQAQYDVMFQEQDYCCAICKRSNFTYHPHVDHCHSTGKVRGLLCAPCNAYLGYSKDNPEVYEAAIKYLGEYHRD